LECGAIVVALAFTTGVGVVSAAASYMAAFLVASLMVPHKALGWAWLLDSLLRSRVLPKVGSVPASPYLGLYGSY